MAKQVAKKTVKKQKQIVTTGTGRVYVSTTFNNTIVTVTNEKGDAVAWSSAGAAGFKGSRKSTPFASTSVAEEALKKAKALGVNSVEVYIKGPGVGRDAALRAVRNSGMAILLIADITPIPHNGPRPKKRRRN
jgi:small subunit ribosomal protein S11